MTRFHGSYWSAGAAGRALRTTSTERGETWQDSAFCTQVDPELWFPERGQTAKAARKICGACPVRETCLDWGLEHNEEFGVWGGILPRQFPAVRAQRVAAAAADDARLQAERDRLEAERAARRERVLAAHLARRVPPLELSGADEALFWARTRPGGCGIIWAGPVAADGTGVCELLDRRQLAAHRVAYRLLTGRDAGTDEPWQACGNPACVTPRCLAPSTVNLTPRMRLAA